MRDDRTYQTEPYMPYNPASMSGMKTTTKEGEWMRDATKEERESIDNYIKSISHKIGDEIDLPIKHESKPYLMIPLPDGATNGDMIKALFPNDDINPSTITSIIQKIPFGRNEYCSDWWNAPYKK